MASELIATGSVAATSSDIVVTDGQKVLLFLKTASGPIPKDAKVSVSVKDSGGLYNVMDWLNADKPGGVLDVAGTYQVARYATGAVVGVGRT